MEDYMYENASASAGWLDYLPLIATVAVYCFWSWAQVRWADKLGRKQIGWWAWIPVLSWYLDCKLAGKPDWWFVLCFVPGVNAVVFLILYARIAKSLGLSSAWGVVALVVPAIGFFALAKMALAPPPGSQIANPSSRPQPRQPAQVG
jgi:hypothetical protein